MERKAERGLTPKAERDIATVREMIGLYCHKKHGTPKGELCAECGELFEYARLRRIKCPHGDAKPSCSHCTIRCYKPDMRQRIGEVMKFSGPRLLIYDPQAALRHLFFGRRPGKGTSASVPKNKKKQEGGVNKHD